MVNKEMERQGKGGNWAGKEGEKKRKELCMELFRAELSFVVYLSSSAL